ncbi:MAG: threonine synthase [Haliscomenobacter sp.]|nr:threonine synthase [Haliscomenobacter sp.]
MLLYSTKNPTLRVTLKEAVMKGLPDDNGLFMPSWIPELPAGFIKDLRSYSFQEISLTIADALFQHAIPYKDLEAIILHAVNFPAPVVRLDEYRYVLELFHGPSLAFKDFGARFMAQLMGYFNQEEKKPLTILVATSGDTGGAVAAGFFRTPGIEVVILYPSKKVSLLQEKQLTTWGHNIAALEIDGTFDDCQSMVKQAFLDAELTHHLRLSSANSINIARLIPQSFYYFEAFKQLPAEGEPIVFSIPSGNFGTLSAGLMAKKMGLPVQQFLAATNTNDIVPKYLHTGIFSPRPSIPTLSNAMDVGNPSNFPRILDLFPETRECSTWNMITQAISGEGFSDQETENAMREIYSQYHYIMDPHGAVGYLAMQRYQQKQPNHRGIILETAHPAKFLSDVERILGFSIPVPERLASLENRTKQSTPLKAEFRELKSYLMDRIQ